MYKIISSCEISIKLEEKFKIYTTNCHVATCVIYDINLYLSYSCDVLDLQRTDIDFNDLDH